MEIPIGEVKKRLCELVDRAERGETITILRHGKPTARLAPLQGRGKPWRVAKPDDPALYKGIDLNEPILGDIE
jgi:prevent-host-death family protein